VGDYPQERDRLVLPVITAEQGNWDTLSYGFPAKDRAPDIGRSIHVVLSLTAMTMWQQRQHSGVKTGYGGHPRTSPADSVNGGWEAYHHDTCRVTGSSILLMTIGKNQVAVGYPQRVNYFVLPVT